MSALPEEAAADIGEQRLSPAILEILPGQDETAREKWLFSPVFVRLLATNAAFGFSVSTFYLLPKHLAVSFAATPGQIGLVSGIFSLAALLCVPFLGPTVERLGYRRASIAGFLLMAACAFNFAFVDSIAPVLWTLRALQGLAASIVFAASVALVSAVAPPDKLGQAMGLSGAASLAMSAVAPAIAESLGARYGFGYAFALAGVAALLGAMASRGLPKLGMAFGPHARSLFAIPGPNGWDFGTQPHWASPSMESSSRELAWPDQRTWCRWDSCSASPTARFSLPSWPCWQRQSRPASFFGWRECPT